MPNLNPNSTDYVHSSEPNTNDLTMAMDYTGEGKPAIRVLSNIQGDITIDGDVNIPGIVTVTNTDDDPLFTHTHLYDESDVEYSAANPFTIDGTVTALQGTDPWTVDGTVELGATSLSALENINATVNGTVTVDSITGAVTITDGGSSITVDGSVSATVSGTVSVDNFPATQTVDGTVNIGTLPEVEVKNDVGNPLNINILEGGVAVDGANALPIRQLNDDGLIAYARGGAVTESDVLNSYLIDKSGSTETLGTSSATMTTVWDGGGLYPWTTFTGSGAHIFVASATDDAKMRGVAITIEGLDSNYNLISEVVTMDASDTTTVQETTQNFYRIVKATVTGTNTNSIPNDYDITFKYGSSGGTVVAKILATYGATQSCTYTIPAGYQAFILAVNGSSGQQDEITTMIWKRPFNSAWSQVKTFKFISGSFEHNMRTPLVFNEKTDIEIRAYALVESSRIGTEFQLLLVPNVT